MLNEQTIKKKTGKVKMAKNFKKFRCSIWFNTETLQMFEVSKHFQNYDITELDVFGNEFSGEVEIVPLLVKMSKMPVEYLGEV